MNTIELIFCPEPRLYMRGYLATFADTLGTVTSNAEVLPLAREVFPEATRIVDAELVDESVGGYAIYAGRAR